MRRQTSQQISSSQVRVAATAENLDDRLVRGRLIVVLDALLKTGSATLAAKQLGLQTSAVSRMLGQLREILGDPIFVRSGRGLMPTPYAEKIRPVVGAVVGGIDAIFDSSSELRGADAPLDDEWNVPSGLDVPALKTRSARLLEGQPAPHDIEQRLAQINATASPQVRLGKLLATVSTGSGHRRPLAIEEARAALDIILSGEADPIQIGALMGIIQLRNPTAGELAGFVQSARASIARHFDLGEGAADIDWPAYVSPNQRNPPWFFHAARLVSLAGHRVLLHGSSGTSDRSGRLELIASALKIPVVTTVAETREALQKNRIAYLPLGAFAPQIYRLLALHALTGHRSPVRNALYLVNPANAPAALFGVPQPSYKELHRETARLLNSGNISILNNVRDAAQFTPFRATVIHRIQEGRSSDIKIAAVREPRTERRARTTTIDYWKGVWSGAVVDERAEIIILSTAAAALLTAGNGADPNFEAAYEQARDLWRNRER